MIERRSGHGSSAWPSLTLHVGMQTIEETPTGDARSKAGLRARRDDETMIPVRASAGAADHVMADRPRVLFVATVDSHLYYFHLPFMRLLRDMGYEVEAAAGPSGYAARIESAGFRVIPFGFSKNPVAPRLPGIAAALIQLMRERRYVLVHVHTPIAGFVGRYAAHVAGVPHIMYTAHGFHFHPLGALVENRLFIAVEKLASRWTDVLVVMNHEDAAAAHALFARPGLDIEEVPGVGVDTTVFVPPEPRARGLSRDQLSIADAGLVVGWVGEFTRRKRPADLLEVARRLAISLPDTRFLMAGEGPLESDTRQTVKIRRLQGTVLFPGWQADVPSFLAGCDTLVSTASQEGLPRNILEAMACGLPVVAWNIRGCRDLVVDGTTGFLLPYGDIDGMCARLEQLAHDEGMRRAMGAAGRERVEREFSQDRVLEDMKRIYVSLLDGRLG
jgi:glycosyltransferase involved in cell wall biosynthesis